MPCKRGSCEEGYACNRKSKTCVSKRKQKNRTIKKTKLRGVSLKEIENNIASKFNTSIKIKKLTTDYMDTTSHINMTFSLPQYDCQIYVNLLCFNNVAGFNIRQEIFCDVVRDKIRHPWIFLNKLPTKMANHKLSIKDLKEGKKLLHTSDKNDVQHIFNLSHYTALHILNLAT